MSHLSYWNKGERVLFKMEQYTHKGHARMVQFDFETCDFNYLDFNGKIYVNKPETLANVKKQLETRSRHWYREVPFKRFICFKKAHFWGQNSEGHLFVWRSGSSSEAGQTSCDTFFSLHFVATLLRRRNSQPVSISDGGPGGKFDPAIIVFPDRTGCERLTELWFALSSHHCHATLNPSPAIKNQRFSH